VKRHFLSKRETKEFKTLLDSFGISVESKTLEIEENDHSVIYDGSVPILVKFQEKWLPTLKIMNARNFPKVVIDQGAYEGIKNGANLYSAGVKSVVGTLRKGLTCIIEDPAGRQVGSASVESDETDIISKKRGSYLKVYELYK
jgi:predicted ribosome-associated RNA-binding protein Tma20